MSYVFDNYQKVARKDGKTNVYIAPFYCMYNHHHNYWEDWNHAYLLNHELTDIFGHRSPTPMLPENEEGFLIETVVVDGILIIGDEICKEGLAISLSAGEHFVTVSGKIHVKNHGISAYEYGSDKNWHRESFELSTSITVSDYGDAYLALLMHLGKKVKRNEKFQIVTSKVVETTEYFRGFVIDYEFYQTTKKFIDDLVPGCRYIEKKTTHVAPTTSTTEEFESVKSYKTYSQDERYRAVECQNDSGFMSFLDTRAEFGVMGGASLTFGNSDGEYKLRECENPDNDEVYAGVNLYRVGDNKLYLYDHYGDVGPLLCFDNNGRMYFEFKDTDGLHQGFKISFNKSNIIITEVNDGVQSGKFIKLTDDSVYEGAYTSGGENTEYLTYVGRKSYPRGKIPFPNMYPDNFVHLRKMEDDRSPDAYYCGNMSTYLSGGDLVFQPHGHGVFYRGSTCTMGEFRNGEPTGFTVTNCKGCFTEFSHYENGQRNGLNFSYYHNNGEVKIEIYKDGRPQDISVKIERDHIIFIDNNNLNYSHFGIAKNPLRATSYEYKNGEWQEYKYSTPRVCSLLGVQKTVSIPRVKSTVTFTAPPSAPTLKKPTIPKTKKAPSTSKKATTTVKAEPVVNEVPIVKETPKKENPFENKQSNATPLECFDIDIADDGDVAIGGMAKHVKNVVIPDGVTTILMGAFDSDNMESIVIPESVTSIGRKAFSACMFLERIEINARVEVIKQNTFEYCLFESITLPDTVKTVEANAFKKCLALKTLSVPADCNVSTEGLPEGCNVIRR